ncbi:MAG: hypothetical protein ABTQ26_00190 [Azonexus sp.]
MRDHLQAVARQTGVVPEDLEIPQVPPACSTVWTAFAGLAKTRQSGGMGLSAISQADVYYWQQNNNVTLSPWEVETIHAIDSAVFHEMNKVHSNGDSDRNATD